MNKMQVRVKEFTKKHCLDTTPEHRVLDAMSEIGELSKEILKASNYGKSDFQFRKEIMEETGDVMFSLMALANTFDINLDDALELVLKKYEKRLKKGSAGSEKD